MIRKYWWLLLLLLLPVGYFLWKYYQHKKEVNASAARAREAKALKSLQNVEENQ
jgi:cbb3-type cytochrome oxidase subunit 3